MIFSLNRQNLQIVKKNMTRIKESSHKVRQNDFDLTNIYIYVFDCPWGFGGGGSGQMVGSIDLRGEK